MEARKVPKEVKNYITYKKLKNDIFSLKIKISNLEYELELLKGGPKDVKAQNYDLKSGSSYVLNINDLYKRIETTSKEINSCKKRLLELEFARDDLEDWLNYESTKLEKKVFYLKEVEEMNLKGISEELDVSYDYIREVSANITKKIDKFLKVPTKTHKNWE